MRPVPSLSLRQAMIFQSLEATIQVRKTLCVAGTGKSEGLRKGLATSQMKKHRKEGNVKQENQTDAFACVLDSGRAEELAKSRSYTD